jgi:hypothetical protein
MGMQTKLVMKKTIEAINKSFEVFRKILVRAPIKTQGKSSISKYFIATDRNCLRRQFSARTLMSLLDLPLDVQNVIFCVCDTDDWFTLKCTCYHLLAYFKAKPLHLTIRSQDKISAARLSRYYNANLTEIDIRGQFTGTNSTITSTFGKGLLQATNLRTLIISNVRKTSLHFVKFFSRSYL